MTGRPPAPEAMHGWHYEPVPLPPHVWRAVPPDLVTKYPRRCSGTHCTEPRIAELKRRRGRAAAWYGYCAAHLPAYGKWVENGQVMGWRLTRDGEVAS